MSGVALSPVLRPVPAVTRAPGARPAALPRVRPALRLTARGRLVLRVALGTALTALVLALVVAGVLIGSGTADAAQERSSVPAATYMVGPGETLWQVAQRIDPGADPRDTVSRILDLNGLHSANVPAGTRLVLPVLS